ncbi:hypothetical protein JTB14_034933 [Gonioctena quinquepunctata]|nr:hypothetical protein JTB14_034933 [Gonioctena quinquepunctata]
MPTLAKEFSKHNWNLISSRQHHTIALDDDGKVYALGRKDYGRLGLGGDCKDPEELQLISSLEDKKVINVACRSATSFAVTEDGDLYGWGMGTNGQLGTGKSSNCEVPTLIKSKQVQDEKVFRVSSGGQHTIILAISNSNYNQGGCN